jgi:imidazolonepropionase-like amidohydrolase
MSLVLKGASVIDGRGGPPLSDAIIVVDGSKITDIYCAQESQLAWRADAEVYDLSGKYVLPGLIDCHVHLCLDARQLELPDLSGEKDELLLLQAARNAEAALHAGITTVRDCGAVRAIAWSLRDAVARKLVVAPRLILSGRPLTITGGHAHSWGGEADGVEGVKQAVRQLVKEGADFVKVMLTGGLATPGTDSRYPSYTAEELKAIVEEAHRFGRRVAAHCHGTPGIARAVEAGLDSIEHATFLDEHYNRTFDPIVAEKIRSAGIWVVPTLAGGHRNAQRLLDADEPLSQTGQIIAQMERKLEIFRHMSLMGLKMAAGTDAGVPLTYFDDLVLELELMVGQGVPPLQAISLATKAAAELMDRDEEIGTIEPGKEADMLVLGGDPAQNVSMLRDVKMVVQAGKVVVQSRELEQGVKGECNASER